MTYLGVIDYGLEVALGNVDGVASVNKFGRGTDCDSGIDCDVWDRNNSSDAQDIWTAPTQARTHQIASTSANDDGSPAGTGARTIRVYGLTDWDTAEVSEDITMNGTTNVATANSYVIIHRMKVLTKGASGPNVGTITATADTDSTVTAQINVGEGQTQMAIYGWPSTQTLCLTQYYASLLKAGSGVGATISVLVNPEPDAELTAFLVKHTNSIDTDADAHMPQFFDPPTTYAGPGIIKIQANANANNVDASGGFNAYLVTN